MPFLRPLSVAAGLSLPTTMTYRGGDASSLRSPADGTGAAPIQNGVVVVTDDRIVAVGAAGCD